MKRAVVTGLGTVNPLGNDVKTTWEGLVAGRSGIGPITRFDPTPYETRIAGEVKDFDPTSFLDPKEARRMDRYAHLAVAATKEALEDSGLPITEENSDDIGIVLGSGIGGVATLLEQARILETRGPGRVSPFAIPMALVDMASGQLAITFGIKGPNMAVVTACATGSTAIGEGAEMIRRGELIAAVVGGAEAAVLPIAIAGFSAMRVLSRRNEEPQRASRPFDAQRDGLVLSEGAGILILEELEHAKARGARIYAEVAGYGGSDDAVHLAAPAQAGEGLARAMRRALRRAGLKPEEVDYVNPHGTATMLNDREETAAIKAVFGDHAYKLAISSTKSMVGHLMAAAGAVEGIATVLTIFHGIIPPTINLENPDPECDLDYVPGVARKANVRVAVSNNAGLGGHNACVAFKRYEA
ncbi:MAG: beta-ketoacyl-ACP synthase II [Chloroflexota bacterium]